MWRHFHTVIMRACAAGANWVERLTCFHPNAHAFAALQALNRGERPTRFHPKSLRNKLILSFILINIIPTVSISFFYYRYFRNTLEKNMIDTSERSLNYSVTLIEKQLKQAEQLSDWIFININLNDILTKKYPSGGFYYNAKIRTFLDLIDNQLNFNTSIGTYIYSLVIHGNNGLNLCAGQPEGTQIDLAELEKQDWFEKGLALHGKKFWYGLVANPSKVRFEQYLLPIVRPILHSRTTQEIGWHLIGVRTSLISDLFKNYQILPDETLLLLDSRGYCIYHSNQKYVGQNLLRLGYISRVLHGNKQGHLITAINGSSRLVAYAKSESTGWVLVKIFSSVELNRQKRILFKIFLIILLSGMLFTSCFTVYLSSNFTRPFKKLLRQTQEIAAGNFERDPSTEGEDELGVLGRGVNEMAENIRRLLDRVIEDEQEKRQLELEILQNQVNPHFLYNTLNSVKLMATIQKADGIREIVTALGRLLMNLSKNTAEKISLTEELSLLNDYIYIQNIRYKGKIKLDLRISDETCLRYAIIKFTLQPIVENAIFHGIEPKKNAGRILITIEANDDQLIIAIEDDGVGMNPDQIESLLAAAPTEKKRGLSKIGIKNVNERLKLVYGFRYGLSIESVAGEYTKVYVRIPKEAGADDRHE
jgi:two-component system sensor histidine kinase YesM